MTHNCDNIVLIYLKSKINSTISLQKVILMLYLFTQLSNFLMNSKKVKVLETKTVEKEKVVAEKLNGRFAMIGFIAAIGAYLTTGQIIPGFV